MLNIPRPFITARGTYNRCASTRRPTPQRVQGVFEEVSGTLGSVITVGKNPVFFKELPTNVNDGDVREYGMNANTYKEIFDGRDTRLTASQVASFLQKHPSREAYERYNLQRDGNDGNNAAENINGAAHNAAENTIASANSTEWTICVLLMNWFQDMMYDKSEVSSYVYIEKS